MAVRYMSPEQSAERIERHLAERKAAIAAGREPPSLPQQWSPETDARQIALPLADQPAGGMPFGGQSL